MNSNPVHISIAIEELKQKYPRNFNLMKLPPLSPITPEERAHWNQFFDSYLERTREQVRKDAERATAKNKVLVERNKSLVCENAKLRNQIEKLERKEN